MRSGRILHKIDLFLPRESQSRGAAGEASVFSPVVGSVAAQKPVETTDVTESLFVHVHKIRVASDNKRLARCTKMALTQSRKVK